MNYSIRPGTDDDWRGLRMLLPRAFYHGSRARALVAESEDGSRIVGAAAISHRMRREPVAGLRVELSVIPPYRRRGIARQLLSACATIAADEGAAALYTWGPMAAHDSDLAVWRRLGFDCTVAVFQCRAVIDERYEQFASFFQYFVDRQYIPTHAQLFDLTAERAEEIARLHVQYIGGEFNQIVRQIRGELPPPYHPKLSPVIVMDGRVMGFTLARISAPVEALIDATVVIPAMRRGWVNLWLKFAGATACRELGIRNLLFYTYEHHTDSRKMARQYRASTVEMVEPYLLLQTPTSADAPSPAPPGDRTLGLR